MDNCKHKHTTIVYNNGTKIVQKCDECGKDRTFYVENKVKKLAEKLRKEGIISYGVEKQ